MSIGDDDLGRTQPEERSSKSCLVIGLILGGLMGFVLVCGGCCLGGFYFRGQSMAEDIRSDLQDNPVIVEHVGEVESLDIRTGSLFSFGNTYEFRVAGTLRSGTITAECAADGTGVFRVRWGTLTLDNGDEYDLFPDGRDDVTFVTRGEHDQFWSDTFRLEVIDRLVKESIADHAVVVEHVGEIQRLASDEQLSNQEPGDIWIFDITGDKGSGMLRANCVLVADNEINVDSAVLMLDSGENVQLFPDAPMDPLPDRMEAEPDAESTEP